MKKIVSLIIFIVFLSSSTFSDELVLSEMFTTKKFNELLIPQDEWKPFPKAGDQEWKELPDFIQTEIIKKAEDYLQQDFPDLPATLYLEFKQIGNRSNYQDPWFERRMIVHTYALAESIENQGRFVEPLINAVWKISEESSWTFPAHIGAQKAGVDLPDVNEPIVALFSAETASTLAWTAYLLEEQFNNISPLIVDRINHEINQRILTPYLNRRDFGWMGFGSGRRPNNWNPWINSNVLAATLLTEKDKKRRVELVEKVLSSLDNFFVPYPDDGSCDEGPSYWGHAGASLFDNLEWLYLATNGEFDVYDHAKIKAIGQFIYRSNIYDNYFVNIGDCDPKISIYRNVVYRYGKRIDDPNMIQLAGYQLNQDNLVDNISFRYMGRLLFAALNAEELLDSATDQQPWVRDVWLSNEDMQLMVAREKENSYQGLFVAAWGAHNGQSHNHNDVGNYIVYKNGRPFIIDLGRPEYTRKTFSSQRYEILAFQSQYHNLPSINGYDQRSGNQYQASNVKYNMSDEKASLEMNLEEAYSSEAGIEQWNRTVILNRNTEKNIVVQDQYEFKVEQPYVMNLITFSEISKQEDYVLLGDKNSDNQLKMYYNKEKFDMAIQAIELEDDSLYEEWGVDEFYRIQITPKELSDHGDLVIWYE